MSPENGGEDAQNSEPLLFRRLDVIRMPGIEQRGFTLEEFTPGVNVIHGPNAAGKTMLARSMNTLLWPEACGGTNVRVEGACSAEGNEWFVRVEGEERIFQRDGASDPGPKLPPSEQRDRYNLALHELLQTSTTDRTFAELIVQELFGGYDVSAAAEQLGFEADHSYPTINAKTRAEETLNNLQEAREEMSALEREKQELTELREKKREAARAQDRLDLLKRVLDVFDARKEYRKVQSKLDEFPDVMNEVTGQERERVQQLNQEIESLEDQKEQAEKNISEAEQEKEQLNYPYDKLVSDELREWKSRYETLKDLSDEITQLSDDREAAVKKRNEVQKELGEDVKPARLAELRRPDYDDLSGFAREVEEVRNRLEVLETLRSLLNVNDESDDLPDLDRLKRGCEVLENWLSNPSGDREPSSETPWLLYGSQGVIALLSVIAAFFHIGFLIVLLVPLLVVVYEQLISEPSSDTMRSSARREFEQLDLSGAPPDWTTSSVRSHLRSLYEKRAQQVIRQKEQERWEIEREEYEDLSARAEDLEEKRAEITNEFGLAPDADERMLYFLLNRLSRWKDAHSEVLGIDEKRGKKQERYDRILSELNEEFRRWDLPEAGDASDVSSYLRKIRERTQTFQEAKQTIEQARERKSEAESKLPELKDRRDDVYSKLDLEPGDDAALQRLLNRLEEFNELQSELHQKKGIYENKRSELKETSGFDPDLLEQERAEIQREIGDLEREADAYEDIGSKITKIETRLEEASRGYEVEPAMAEKERAFDALRDQLESDYQKMVGHVLTQYVQNVNTARTMPAVFDRARELLARVSTGRYELNVEQSDPPSFRVVDTIRGEGKSLDQLSSGTRIQVLLAVRLAFCQHGEEHVRLPLFMDETLANADDARARIIIDSVLNLAREGRQVFYFTAQGDEVAKWQSVADDRDERIKTYDLREHTDRDLDGSVRIPDLSEVQLSGEDIPRVEDHDHDTYGKELDVPPVDPRADVDAVHLWYLIEDLDTLEHLLSNRVHHWGQLTTLQDHGTDLAENASHRRALRRGRERAKALDTFIEQWRIGRNRPVHRPELRASGAVSDTFINEVTELAEACDGDPEELIERLRAGEVKGFFESNMDELETYFINDGYIDTDDPLEPGLLRAAMRSAVDEDVLEQPGEEIRRMWERIQEHVNDSKG